MKFHEEFTRCDCDEAYLKREELVLATYQKDLAGDVVSFNELPEGRKIRYTCGNCNQYIFTTRE